MAGCHTQITYSPGSPLPAGTVWDAAVESELAAGLGPERLAVITENLARPPLTTCIRVNTRRAEADVLFQELTIAAKASGTAPDTWPRRHPLIPEALLLPGSGPHTVDIQLAGGKEVVVNRKAGEAIMRGAEVFVPGVLACSNGISADDLVVVSAAVELPGSRGFGMSRGYRLGSDPELEARASTRTLLGVGRCRLCRADMFRAQHGVAVVMKERVWRPGHPACALTPGGTMLQNLPSLVAAAVLDPPPGSRVLDLCAAPGGKTTALAARLRGSGVVVALDRSHAKAAQIRRLAEEAGVADIVRAYKGDAVKCILPANTHPGPGPRFEQEDGTETGPGVPTAPAATPVISEGLRRRLERRALARQRHNQAPVVSAHVEEGKEPVCPGFAPASFDHVMCDAPCSALGLRPRLRHEQTVEDLRGTAQYQRAILAAGVAALKPGGTMVFSTCTISHLENEANVRWLLDTFSDMQLAPARPLVGGPGLQRLPDLLHADEAAMVQRFDPGVRAADGLDTIGFFIAKFVKRLPDRRP